MCSSEINHVGWVSGNLWRVINTGKIHANLQLLKIMFAHWDRVTHLCVGNLCQLCKNIDRHTAHNIVSWPNPKQWVIVHTSDLMMIIRQSIYILSIITREFGKLKTHSPTYCIIDKWENMLNLTHTLEQIYLTVLFTPQPLRLRGIVVPRAGGRAGGRADKPR